MNILMNKYRSSGVNFVDNYPRKLRKRDIHQVLCTMLIIPVSFISSYAM